MQKVTFEFQGPERVCPCALAAPGGHQVGQGDGNRGFPQPKLRLVRTVNTDWAEVKGWEGRGKAFHEEAAIYTKGNVCD